MITMLKFGPMGNLAANCYLVETDTGFILIDTARKHRKILERELLRFTGDLTRIHLIILTHGDFDHAGNAAWLMKTYGIPVAMHVGDADMVRTGDMLTGRGISSGVFRWLAKALFSPETFTPSLLLEHGDHLGAYGFNAEVISLPGHSSGSIGILTSLGRPVLRRSLYEPGQACSEPPGGRPGSLSGQPSDGPRSPGETDLSRSWQTLYVPPGRYPMNSEPPSNSKTAAFSLLGKMQRFLASAVKKHSPCDSAFCLCHCFD